MRQAGSDHDQRQTLLAQFVAGGAERGDVVRAEVLHLVDEDGHATTGSGRHSGDVAEQFDQVDLDVTGVRAAGDSGHVDAGLPAVTQRGLGGGGRSRVVPSSRRP